MLLSDSVKMPDIFAVIAPTLDLSPKKSKNKKARSVLLAFLIYSV